MSIKSKNKRVEICLMVVTACLVMAALWAVLATPETALATIRDLRVRHRGLDAGEIETLIAERTGARQRRDWARADAIRDQLSEMGVSLMDSPTGTAWEML